MKVNEKYKRMVRNAQLLLKEDPSNLNASYLLGELHQAQGLYDQAIAQYEKLLSTGLS